MSCLAISPGCLHLKKNKKYTAKMMVWVWKVLLLILSLQKLSLYATVNESLLPRRMKLLVVGGGGVCLVLPGGICGAPVGAGMLGASSPALMLHLSGWWSMAYPHHLLCASYETEVSEHGHSAEMNFCSFKKEKITKYYYVSLLCLSLSLSFWVSNFNCFKTNV